MNRRKLYRWAKAAVKGWLLGTRFQRETIGLFSRGVISGQAENRLKRLKRFLKSKVEWRSYFAVWTRYVVETFKVPQQVVLIVDETKLAARFGVMVV